MLGRLLDFFRKEDPVDQCGWKIFRVFRNPKEDPYLASCEWHDKATSEGSWHQQYVKPERIQEHFEDMLDESDRTAGRPGDSALKAFYKWATRRFTWLFSEGQYESKGEIQKVRTKKAPIVMVGGGRLSRAQREDLTKKIIEDWTRRQ